MSVQGYCPGCGAAVGTKEECLKCSVPAAQPSAQRILYFVTGGAVSLLVIGLIGGIVTAIINWLG